MRISSGAVGLWFYFDSENEDWTRNPFINFMFSTVNYSKEKYMFLILETTKSSVMSYSLSLILTSLYSQTINFT